MRCPKCDYDQEERDTCAMCGVDISKYKYWNRQAEQKIAFPKKVQRQAEQKVVFPKTVRGEDVHSEEKKGISWEDRDRLGFINALISTIKESLFSPTRFFEKMPVIGGPRDPILYSFVVILIGGILSSIGSFWEGGFMPISVRIVSAFAMLIGIPTFAFVSLFISMGIFHLMMLLFGAAKNGFEATLRVIAYSSGASIFAFGGIFVGSLVCGSDTLISFLVPLVGSLVCGIWAIVLQIIGLRQAHQTTTGKAAAAVLIPVMLPAIFILLMILGGVH